MNRKFLRHEGRLLEFSKGPFALGKAYLMEDGCVYPYLGKTRKPADRLEKPGVYFSERTGEYFLVQYPDGKGFRKADLVRNCPLEKLEKVVDDCKKISKEEVMDRKRKKTDAEARQPPLSCEINEDDDEIVRTLKEIVNAKGITMKDVYDASPNNNAGYNLIYGLRKRNTISFESVQKWAKILNMEIKITLVEKE